MSSYQWTDYQVHRTNELDNIKTQNRQITQAIKSGNATLIKKLKAKQFIERIKLKSRQDCNFSYPPTNVLSGKTNKDINPDEIDDQLSDDERKLDGIESDLNASWILNDQKNTHISNLKDYSPKMNKMIHNILTLPGKHMVYGWFKSRYGLYLIYTYLKHCGLDPLIFSGDLSSDIKRSALINAFNHENNKRGEKHKVILISGAGTMGISLFGIRHIHLFEASTNEFFNIQAEGRAFRTRSHHQLPPEERNVQVYRYFTSLPVNQTWPADNNLTTEQQIYQDGIEKKKRVENILRIMKKASFDCSESYNKEIHQICHDYQKTEQSVGLDFRNFSPLE
jgi:hypothetical protein